MTATNAILATLVTVILAIWRTPTLREGVLARVPRLPKWAQPLVPIALGVIVATAEGYASGLRGAALATRAAEAAGEVGLVAIGLWHAGKRIWPVVRKVPPAAALLLVALGLTSACTATRYPSVPNVAIAAVNITDTALAVYIATAPERPAVDLDLLTAAVNRAATIARRKGDACLIVDDVTMVGSAIGCRDCIDVARGLAELAQCSEAP